MTPVVSHNCISHSRWQKLSMPQQYRNGLKMYASLYPVYSEEGQQWCALTGGRSPPPTPVSWLWPMHHRSGLQMNIPYTWLLPRALRSKPAIVHSMAAGRSHTYPSSSTHTREAAHSYMPFRHQPHLNTPRCMPTNALAPTRGKHLTPPRGNQEPLPLSSTSLLYSHTLKSIQASSYLF